MSQFFPISLKGWERVLVFLLWGEGLRQPGCLFNIKAFLRVSFFLFDYCHVFGRRKVIYRSVFVHQVVNNKYKKSGGQAWIFGRRHCFLPIIGSQLIWQLKYTWCWLNARVLKISKDFFSTKLLSPQAFISIKRPSLWLHNRIYHS